MRILLLLLFCSISALAQVPYVSAPTNSPVDSYTVQRTGDRNKWVPMSGGTNVSSDIWTNDTIAGIRVIRPVDQTRSIDPILSSTNYFGLFLEHTDTLGADTFVLGGVVVEHSTNSGLGSLYFANGVYGLAGEVNGNAGGLEVGKEGVGLSGEADSSFSAQYGIQGIAIAQYNLQTNVGIAASTLINSKTGTTNVGLYAETYDATQGSAVAPSMQSAVVLADSRNSGNPLFIGRFLGTNSFLVWTNGGITVGPNTADYWGSYAGKNGETIVSVHNVGAGDPNHNEIEISTVGPGGTLGNMNMINTTNGSDLELFVSNPDPTLKADLLLNAHADASEIKMTGRGAFDWLDFLPDRPANTVGPVYMFNSKYFMTNTATTSPIVAVKNFNTNKFLIMPNGDLYWGANATVGYQAPAGHGAANSVLTDTNGSGALSWQPVSGGGNSNSVAVAAGTNIVIVTNSSLVTVNGLTDTNVVNSLITNGINNNARIGPGTVNQLAMFTSTTNVGDSIVDQVSTNLIEYRTRLAGLTFTNAITNRIYSQVTSSTNWLALELVSAPTENDPAQLRTTHGPGYSKGNDLLLIQEAWQIGPATNHSGQPQGDITPSVDSSTTSVGYTLGSGSARIKGVFTGPQGYSTTARSDAANIRATSGYGIGFNTLDMRFWDNSGNEFLEASAAAPSGFNIGTGSLMGNVFRDFGTASIFLRGTPDRQDGIWQVNTNQASAGTPVQVGFVGTSASGNNLKGGDIMLIGGLSTGTGQGGSVILATAQTNAAASTLNTRQIRHYISPEPIVLTESTATKVCTVSNIISGKFVSIKIFATTHADDGTNYQTVAEELMITDANVGGTMGTAVVSAPALTASFLSSGTLTTAWTAVISANGLDIKCNAVSSLTQTTLKTEYEIVVHSDTNPHIYDASIRHL